MGLAGKTVKRKVGVDPRNTLWANDTDRFGHKHMVKLGWRPGLGIGHTNVGSHTHVKVKIKDDTKGLGKRLDDDAPTGFDMFQEILGRLNGEQAKVQRQITARKALSGVYLNFVHGGYLHGSLEELVQEKEAEEKEAEEKEAEEKEAEEKAAKNDEPAGNVQSKHKPHTHTRMKPRVSGIRATRNRHIAMKQQVTMDEKALNEILMVSFSK